jgi:hypothetical protein
MSSRLLTRLSLEQLEERAVPATVRLIGGSLFVSNPLITSGADSITLTATGNNQFKVQDGTVSLGTYTVGGNIYIFGSNAKDTITVNLAGHTFTGNVLVNSGNANDTVTVTGTGGGNVIAGNVTFLHGNGNASINLNSMPDSTMTVGGSVVAVNTSIGGLNNFQLGNHGTGSDTITSTVVGGSVTLTNFADNGANAAVHIGAGQRDVIGGSLTISSLTSNNVSVFLGAPVSPPPGSPDFVDRVGVTVGGNFSLYAGNGNDTVTFLGSNRITPSINLGTTINGDTNVHFGDGNDYFNVAGNSTIDNGGQQTVFEGNVLFQAGNGNDSFNLAGGQSQSGIGARVNGNLTILLGNGNNDLGDETTATNVGNGGLNYTDSFVGGNLNINVGNGNNILNRMGTQVGGNENFVFGSGNNGTAAVPILLRRPAGGVINWTSGNGNNYVEFAAVGPLGYVTPQTYNVNFHFGNGDDTVQLGSGVSGDVGGIMTGLIDGGGRINGNGFIQNVGWTFASPFTLANFP